MRQSKMSHISITKEPANSAGGGLKHMKLEKNSRQPLYVQLMTELKQMIRSGKYAAGDKIPTEPELAEIYGVSRITVRKTIEQLCKEGYLVKQQGKGYQRPDHALQEGTDPKAYQKIVKCGDNADYHPADSEDDKHYSPYVSSLRKDKLFAVTMDHTKPILSDLPESIYILKV